MIPSATSISPQGATPELVDIVKRSTGVTIFEAFAGPPARRFP
jgi:hypothetical protein